MAFFLYCLLLISQLNEVIIINLETTYYFSLNGSGSYLWQLLDEQNLDAVELTQKMAHKFGEPKDKIRKDVESLMDDLKNDDLIIEKDKK